MKADHLQNLAKALPKREAHLGGIEHMLAKEKAPEKSSRITMF
jgi:hypothetical protein